MIKACDHIMRVALIGVGAIARLVMLKLVEHQASDGNGVHITSVLVRSAAREQTSAHVSADTTVVTSLED